MIVDEPAPGARRRRLLTAAIAAVAVLGVAVAALAVSPGDQRPTPPVAPEVRLDQLTADDLRDARKWAERDAPRPKLAQAPPPGDGQREEGEERAPDHILKENARIRRELDHLEALAAERRRVSKTLVSAGAGYNAPLRLGAGGLAWPINGPLTSPFGQRWGRLHAGVDISAAPGTPIRAAASGRVVLAGWQGGYGNYTCVKHTSSLSTCYAHQSRLGTSAGKAVRQGQVMGFVGNTGHSFGAHLHFETWVSGRPVDPMLYL